MLRCRKASLVGAGEAASAHHAVVANHTAARMTTAERMTARCAGFDDANGNPAYRLLKFPPGEEGERLRALFDQHVEGRDGRHRE
jgi:hypothetical protein